MKRRLHNYPVKYLKHGLKHCQCEICGMEKLIGVKGGGLIYAGMIRHVNACAVKAEKKGKGYICECGRYHKFNGWYFAHVGITDIKHECKCGKVNIL